MIVLIGIPSESPMRMVADALDELAQPYVVWNQRHVAQSHMQFEIAHGTFEGLLITGGIEINLNEITGVYVRAMDDTQLPELKGLPYNSPERQHSRAQHEALMTWLDLTSARVANRPTANGSNGSKPWQTRLIAAASSDIRTPDTIVSNDPVAVRAFRDQHGELIYKSASGFRSVVKPLRESDDERLNAIHWCPVQFQRRVPGRDVRVHIVGDDIFATRIISDAADYRYASRDGLETELEAFELPELLANACRKLSIGLDLPFAGVDLRIQEDGTTWCFEVNPCPGFSYYQSHTGQPIAAAVARYLANMS
jgi:RimK-like ATP-grasp domain